MDHKARAIEGQIKWGKVMLLLSELYELFEQVGHTVEVFNKFEELMEAYDEWLD